MSEVTLIGFITIPEGDLDAVRSELPTHIELTRAEAGCLEFHVDPDPITPTRYHVKERFVDPPSFAAHQQRVQSSRWGEVTARVERHYEITGLPE